MAVSIILKVVGLVENHNDDTREVTEEYRNSCESLGYLPKQLEKICLSFVLERIDLVSAYNLRELELKAKEFNRVTVTVLSPQ